MAVVAPSGLFMQTSFRRNARDTRGSYSRVVPGRSTSTGWWHRTGAIFTESVTINTLHESCSNVYEHYWR